MINDDIKQQSGRIEPDQADQEQKVVPGEENLFGDSGQGISMKKKLMGGKGNLREQCWGIDIGKLSSKNDEVKQQRR